MLIALTLVFSTASCGPKPAVAAPAADAPADEEPMAEKTSITILMPDNPVAFNGINTDTGYEQALGELVMLSLAEVDPNGNFYPELAVEIPNHFYTGGHNPNC